MEQTPYLEHRDKPWGFELVYTPPELPYTGKILNVQAGKKLSLQYHDIKIETMLLLTGEAILHIGPDIEHLQAVKMVLGQGYTIPVMEVHRLEAVTDTQVLECSTGEVGTTYRLQDDYSRENEVR